MKTKGRHSDAPSGCQCPAGFPRVVTRDQDAWGSGCLLYGYGVSVKVLIHRSPCQRHDDVQSATAVKIR